MANARAAQISAHLNYPKGMFAGQTAIVTGSGQGIGAEAVRLFANEGANVIVSDIDASTSMIGVLYQAWSNTLTRILQARRRRWPRTSTSLADVL